MSDRRHLELLTLPELASRLRQTTVTVMKRRDLPACVRIAGRRLWFVGDCEDLFLPDDRWSEGQEAAATGGNGRCRHGAPDQAVAGSTMRIAGPGRSGAGNGITGFAAWPAQGPYSGTSVDTARIMSA